MAVGRFKNSSGVYVTLAERWNGSKWEIQTTPNPEGAKASYLAGVSCVSLSVCEAVNYFVNSSSLTLPLALGVN
jgi:hypothetical protein